MVGPLTFWVVHLGWITPRYLPEETRYRSRFLDLSGCARTSSIVSPGFPPQLLAETRSRATCQILEQVLPKRRLRSNPRVVRKRMSPYPTKYPNHSNWPQPSREAKDLIYIIAAGP